MRDFAEQYTLNMSKALVDLCELRLRAATLSGDEFVQSFAVIMDEYVERTRMIIEEDISRTVESQE
jgi:hypothetical protein